MNHLDLNLAYVSSLKQKANTKALQIAIPISMAYTDVQFWKYFWALKWSFGVSNHSAKSYCPVLQKMRHKKWNGLLEQSKANKCMLYRSSLTMPSTLCHMLTTTYLSWRNWRLSQNRGFRGTGIEDSNQNSGELWFLFLHLCNQHRRS